MSPVRATARGAQRTSLDGTRVDVLVCGASFAGLAAARELAGSGAAVLLVDRYEVGERQTSACAVPEPWVEEMGVGESVRAVLPAMTCTTPHGTVRLELPWAWAAFDYRTLCRALLAQCDARFETAKVQGVTRGAVHVVHTDRGDLHAPLVVDALGWRRILGDPGYQPPAAPLSRGLEVHPDVDPSGAGDALDLWVERGLARRGYGWRVPAGAEARIGACSYDPAQHVKRATVALAERLDADPVRYQGNWFPHRLRDATEDGVFFAGDSAGHCFALSGEGIRTAFHFGMACGAELSEVVAGRRSREDALRRYGRFSAGHAAAFRRAQRLQRLVPALPPRVLHLGLRLVACRAVTRRAFTWYLDQAHPRDARRSRARQAARVPRPAPVASAAPS